MSMNMMRDETSLPFDTQYNKTFKIISDAYNNATTNRGDDSGDVSSVVV